VLDTLVNPIDAEEFSETTDRLLGGVAVKTDAVICVADLAAMFIKTFRVVALATEGTISLNSCVPG
jgi:hypothetical protein